MFTGHLQALFYMRPPNSQLVGSKPGNGPLYRAFDEPILILGGTFHKIYPNFEF